LDQFCRIVNIHVGVLVMFSVLAAASLMTLLQGLAERRNQPALTEALAKLQNGPGNRETDCENASYRVLSNEEIRTAVVDSEVIYDWHGAIYRGAVLERFSARSSRYRIQYDTHTGAGTYEVREGRLCTQERGPDFNSCRRLFHSDHCGYAFSAPDNDQPVYRVRIVNRIDH
jgi:hypothetical protein